MSKNTNNILKLITCVGIFFIVLFLFSFLPFAYDKTNVSKFYLANGANDTGAANLVTAIVLGFRGFDTLGEVLVLFLASLGVGVVLGMPEDKKEGISPSSLIVQIMANLIFPFILIFGIYIFIHGHLTPGGGFQGGAILASGFLFLYLAYDKIFNFEISDSLESFSGLGFVLLGILGIIFGGAFLFNFLPKGNLMQVFSAGIIPIIYTFIGIKVGSELSSIIYRMMK